MTPIRCDRKATPHWLAIPEPDRRLIEASIPDGHYITILDSNASPRWSVRLLMAPRSDSQPAILVRSYRGHHLESTVRHVLMAVAA